jgi:hypothetical protein
MAVFLLVGAAIAALAGITLSWPGTALDGIWKLNPHAYEELAPFGRSIGLAFFLLSFALATACQGWISRRRWGWRLAVAIIGAQVLGDLVNALRGQVFAGALGVSIAGMLLFYLTRKNVKAEFGATRGAA